MDVHACNKTLKNSPACDFAGQLQTWQPVREEEEERSDEILMRKTVIGHLPGQGLRESACYSLTL